MKKTLIALAVLAASGASFAQVTITGNLTMGYQGASSGASAGGNSSDSSGFGVDTSQIDFAATEDLGGGMKATAKMSLAGADRSGESNSVTGGDVTGRDASLTLQTNVGLFVLGSAKAGDYLSGGIAGVGAYYSGWDGKVLSARSRRDTASYVLPINDFKFLLSYQEAANNQGLGNGTSGSNSLAAGSVGQTLQVIGLNYAKGALVVDGQFLNWLSSANSNQTTTAASLVAANAVSGSPTAVAAVLAGSTPTAKTQVRLSGSYDLGMVKFGLGHVVTTYDNGINANPKTYDSLVGASVPLGALTLGAQFVTRRNDDLAASQLATLVQNGTQNGWNVQAAYALSKRTSMIANYARWDATIGNTTQANQTQLLLSHSF
jgi:predicted porin